MKKESLLIEIGCEDLPSWAGPFMAKNWIPRLESIMRENRMDYTSCNFFHTHRRLVIHFKNLPERQKDITREIYGPPEAAGIDGKGNYTKAAIGFAESYGMKTENLVLREKKGKKVLSLLIEEKGLSVEKIIGSAITESLGKTEMPRTMAWNAGNFRFIRPVRWILALYGDRKIDIRIGNVKSGRYSFGHRVLSPKRFKAVSPEDFLDKAIKNFVIFDSELRYEFSVAQIRKEAGDDISFQEGHLRQVADTTEYPVPVKCTLKKDYAEMPREILTAVIKKLQGIPVSDRSGRLKTFYMQISDGVNNDSVNGNYTSVLSSKMEDALFFMKQDTVNPLSAYTENLKRISYHPRWGSVYDRVKRLEKISLIICEKAGTDAETKHSVSTIASLCKNDLATLMVAEFPELQGCIGRIYAGMNGLSETICFGIEDHYLPRHPGDALPRTIESSIVSAAERIETLCGMFLDGIEIKGAGDPYGIKKTATGLIEIIWGKKLSFSLKEAVSESLKLFNTEVPENTPGKISLFILQRTENLLAGEGLLPGIRKAVISSEKADLLNIRMKADALKEFFSKGKAKNVLVPFIRVANILKQAEEKGIVFNFNPDESLMKEDAEKRLYDCFAANREILICLYNEQKYKVFLENLATWRNPVDTFFDRILVMSEDTELRTNRLALLSAINDIFSLFADFSLIPIQEVEDV